MDTNDPNATGSEVLSQSEVERLLAQVAEQESKATVLKSDGEVAAHHKDSIQAYDFRNPAYIAAGDMRKLRIEHEGYLDRLAALLSIYVRMEVGLQMSKLQTIAYSKFTENIHNPAHLVLFKIEPLRGICILDINPRLGLTMVDRLMGGTGQAPAQGHELSEIEAALLEQVMQMFVGEWCRHWNKFQDLKPVIIGHENSGQFLQTSQPDTMMLVMSVEARLGECLEQIQMAFPFATIEPLLRQLSEAFNAPPGEDRPILNERPRWNPELEKARIAITAEWPALEMTARDLTNLKVGDVLPLEPEIVNHVSLRISKAPKFTGRLGTQGSKWAIEITQSIKS
jgi:flagellar motor switch protein FliM